MAKQKKPTKKPVKRVKNGSHVMPLKFIQIQCIAVSLEEGNGIELYGLTADGQVWCKLSGDKYWYKESMESGENKNEQQ
jgi:hypothetical protein